MTSSQRHFNYQPNSNLSLVEESQPESQEEPSVIPLRSQLALEYRLQDLCQRLLESYKDQHDWEAVGQVAQSLVTNSQRVSLLKERLLSGNFYSTQQRRLQSITEQTSDGQGRSLLISEVTPDTGTESGSESCSSVELEQKDVATLCLDSRSGRGIPDTASVDKPGSASSNSGDSSAVDYETASQQTTTSEAEPETSTTGLDSSSSGTNNSSGVQLLSSASTTPSPAHNSSGCCASEDTATQQTPELIEPALFESRTEQAAPGCEFSPSEVDKGGLTSGEEARTVESDMDAVERGEVGASFGSGGAPVVVSSNAESCVGGEEGTLVDGEGVWRGELNGTEDLIKSHRENGSGIAGDDLTALANGCTERNHSNSCPSDELSPTENTSLSPIPRRLMSLSGSDPNIHVSFPPNTGQPPTTADDSRLHTAVVNMDRSASSEDLETSLPNDSSRVNRKRQVSIPNFVSKQTRGLRKSTRKLVKRMGSITIGRGGRRSLDTTGNTLSVMTPSPIRSQDWDPTCLLEELYGEYRRVARSSTHENARHFGYLEKLPVAQTKKSILKGYKRRYFRAIEGNLYYYEDRLSERALGFLKLGDCKLVIIPEKLQLCLTESNGKILVMRAHNHVELSEWHRALQLESVHPTNVISRSAMEENPVIIMDVGACSVRVGIAGEDAYPELFFPAVCSMDTSTEECNDCGLGALLPENRFGAKLVYPRRSTAHISRNSTASNQAIIDMVDTVLNHYNLQAYQCSLLMTVPPTVPQSERAELAEALLSSVFQFQSILFQEQAILSLYSYNTTAGVVVDIGDHIDIVPVIDGYPIEAGINRLPFGGNAITEYLTKLLTAKGIRYFSETETYINRFIKEDACVVSLKYVQDCENCESKPSLYSHQINVDRFQLPDHRKAIVLDDARFKAPEGLFIPGLWGKDVTGLHDLVWKSIQACPIDHRKLLLRNIYLSGGTSLLPGLQERLKAEISTLAPAGNTVEVHASENRQHAAFLGAAILAGLSSFHQSVITQEEWNSQGPDALNKWSS